MAMDQCTRYRWNAFLNTKDKASEKLIFIIKKIHSLGFIIKFIRADNDGENVVTEKSLQDANIQRIQLEYTDPRTPQQNE